jgi:hypothetical protein
MKKTLSKLMIVCCVFALVSCKKSSSDAPKNTLSMSLKVNGTAETSKGAPVATYSKDQGILQIAGAFNTSETINIVIENPKVGAFEADNALLTYSTAPDVDHTWMGETGNVTITNMTADAVEGTFNFEGTSNGVTKTITEGKFSAKMITQ